MKDYNLKCIFINGDKNDSLGLDIKIKVENLVIYLIKFCGGFSVNVWLFSDCGELWLLFNNLFYFILLCFDIVEK